MLESCLITAILFILPAEKPHLDYKKIQCLLKPPTEVTISEHHELVITQLGTRYTIPLIRHDGDYEIHYRLGEDCAKFRRLDVGNTQDRAGAALVDSQWSKIQVGILGPPGGI